MDLKIISARIELFLTRLEKTSQELKNKRAELVIAKREDDKEAMETLKLEIKSLEEERENILAALRANEYLIQAEYTSYLKLAVPIKGTEHFKELIRLEIVNRGLDRQAQRLAQDRFGKKFHQLEGAELWEFWEIFTEMYKLESLWF